MIKYAPIVIAACILTLSACKNNDKNYDASGTFEADEVIVSSEANGRIIQLNIDEGAQVKAGETIGYVDSLQLWLKRKQLQANIRAVESRRPDITRQIAALQQQIVTATTEKHRIENLLKANAANQKQLDDINAQIAVLQKQLDAQRSTLEISTRGISEDGSVLAVQIAQLDDQLQKCRITSPIEGTVLVKYAEAGEVTAQGKPMFKVANVSTMTLRAYVTADQLTKIKSGQSVKVHSDFGKDETREYNGTITWISDKSEFTPKTVQTRDERANLVYAVKVEVKNDGYLKIGMYGNFKIGQ
ncbi:MAG TPA: HlyD family efflux transporter periplasmic adaptor subunit [Bacteroidales bacterium]|nr:HlyD family efflux transporter periplasmic adaptor subunit [Bacteroidales bacterium]